MNSIFLFRNDDVRDKLDESLIQITDLFIKYNIPITHAVEPANATPEVIQWLLDTKKKHPTIIEIIQHGFAHKLNYQKVIGGKLRKGEFGGDRTYEEQFSEIREGKELMDKYFGDQWFPIFTFPYGARNQEAVKAVSDAGFIAVNGGVSPNKKQQMFYKVGRILKKEYLFKRKVSWNLKYKPNTKLFQIDLGISIIKKYHDEGTNCDMNTLDALKAKTNNYLTLPNVGVILHHRYHNTDDRIKLVDDYLQWIKTIDGVTFSKQEDIYRLFG